MLLFTNDKQYFMDTLYFMNQHYGLDINNPLQY